MSEQTFFFYDVETSGFDPKTMRIMQFAGQRTDLQLKPLGRPVNWLVKLSDDVLPDPAAVLLTGITPQKSRQAGLSEAEFCRKLFRQVLTPGTIVTGFNNIRFDDDFLRYTFYRNFYDPYEWAWAEGRSRWDLLDVVRLMRAIRPDGINWPVDKDGLPTNRLEAISAANGLDHASAHDALSDVSALIGLARLIRNKQPKLFNYLLGMRLKKRVAELVSLDQPQPFLYSSGRYDSQWLKTTAVYPIGQSGKSGGVLVWDLRQDPDDFAGLSRRQIADLITSKRSDELKQSGGLNSPVKELSLNRCPAVAPMGVLDPDSRQRLGLDLASVETNLRKLRRNRQVAAEFVQAWAARAPFERATDVDGQLYDGFLDDSDRRLLDLVRQAEPRELQSIGDKFKDRRMRELLLRYKARNFESFLDSEERAAWEEYRTARLKADWPNFSRKLAEAQAAELDAERRFLVEELKLWAESIIPAE